MTTDDPGAPEQEDPVLEARIQHALKPYLGRLTPEALTEARRALTLVLTTHPVAVRLMNRLRERNPQGASGVTTTPAEAAAIEQPGGEAQSGRSKRRTRR